MKRLQIHFPEKLIEFIDKLVELKLIPSRAEFIRQAVKDSISKESAFLSNFNSDIKKLNELHRKYIEINEEVRHQFFPGYQKITESTFSTVKSGLQEKKMVNLS